MAERPSRLPAVPDPGATAPDPAGHPLGTDDAAWCRLLLWAPEVDATDRLGARTPLAHRPERRAVLVDRAGSLRRAAPGIAVVAFVVLVLAGIVGGLAVGAAVAGSVVLLSFGVSAAAGTRAVRRADRSTATDTARRSLRQRLAAQAVDPTALAPPWRQLAEQTALLQLAVATSEDPRALAAVDEAAGRVVTAIAADADLRTASDTVRRVVAAAPDADVDADVLRTRLADADAASAALVSDAGAALEEARTAVSVARSGDAAVESARLRALGDLDRAVTAARALETGSGERRSQDGNQDT